MAIECKSRIIRIPVHMYKIISVYQKCCNSLQNRLKREPTEFEIANEMKVSMNVIMTIKDILIKPISLNQWIDEYSETEYGHYIQDENMDVKNEVVNNILNKCLSVEIQQMLDSCGLTTIEKKVIIYWYRSQHENLKLLSEVGKIIGFSKERVRQIEIKALKKIRNSSNIEILANYMDNPKEALKNVHEIMMSEIKVKEEKKKLIKQMKSKIRAY